MNGDFIRFLTRDKFSVAELYMRELPNCKTVDRSPSDPPPPTMIACRVDRAWKYTNSLFISKRVQFLQDHCFHHGLNYDRKMGGAKDRKNVTDLKRRKTSISMWRPVSTQSSSQEYVVNKLQVDFEDLQNMDEEGKLEEVEVQEVYHSISSHTSDIQYTCEDGEATNEPAGTTFGCRSYQDSNEGRTSKGGTVPSDEKYSISVQVGASLMRFIKGKGGSVQKNIEEEIGVKILFPSSREDDYLVIEGISEESVNRASERIKVIVDKAMKSPYLDYSHFVSLPLAIHPELVDKLLNFQNSILRTSNTNEYENLDSDSHEDTSEDEDKAQMLDTVSGVAVNLKVEGNNEHVQVDITNISPVSYAPKARKPFELRSSEPSKLSDLGIEKSIFNKPKTFHLTVLMLKLWNKDRVCAASEVLQSVSSKVLEALDNKPVFVRLKGLECMKGSLAKARVVYVPVEEIGSEGRLLRACQVIIDAFVEAGLVLERDAQQNLKLHATVMNARHRKWKKGRRRSDSFDARGIFKQFGSEEWGEYLIREAHLSRRFAFDENGYYHCCASIPFPESMQLD
ncbi:hypothetical protein NMG60_11002567 [Bertholletia excelsa]